MPQPKPMDALLCSGNGPLSRGIICFNKLQSIPYPAHTISHFAMMSWRNFVSESTTRNRWANKKGVQANQLEVWLKNYDGRVWIRPFLLDPMPLQDKIDMYDIDSFGIPYESGIPGAFELWRAGKGLGGAKATTNIHCSENGTRKLKLCGFLPMGCPDYLFSPAQYWLGGRVDKEIKRHYGEVIFGPPERLK